MLYLLSGAGIVWPMHSKHSEVINKALVHNLISTHKLISDQVNTRELTIILEQLTKTISEGSEDNVVEFGCFTGTTSLFIQRILQDYNISPRQFHVYDSFAGLPEKSSQDQSPAGTQFTAGKLHATKKQFINNFKNANLPLPVIHKCWFNIVKPDDVPRNISFAFLDGDYYDSIADSLRLIEAKLSKGATIVVDDYQSEQLPGARKAVDAWLRGKPYKLQVQASLAVIQT